VVKNTLLVGHDKTTPINHEYSADYTPLSAIERIIITTFFVIILPGGLLSFGIGLIPLLIIIGSLYAWKKDGDYMYIENANKYIRYYFIGVGYVFLTGMSFYWFWPPPTYNIHSFLTSDVWWLIFWPISTYIVIHYMYQKMYFDILDNHRSWVEKNGIYGG
jgi:hypothetical protein